MIEAIAPMFREFRPRKTAANLAYMLGVSHRTARRYLEQPHLIPLSRAEQLLIIIEQEEAALEARRVKRRAAREAIQREIRSALGLADPCLPLPPIGEGRRRLGDTVGEGREVLPDEGGTSRVGRGGTP